ncbi:MAG: hypothetical protein A2Y10_02280 [Planctomycetes bacterium GWF2_41_51]|nr:MAG: hypothetical protein A2Y10_02280 [Planctomycetes bacterium GWF2_41_51]HBG25764.1 hypothetical protein [Phycisphaerales bacterium]
MAITFHCECCKKKINAPDTAGGKWGKCPYCNHKCYIPLPPSEDDEELKLAPIDETEEEKYTRMMLETQNLTRSLLHQTQEPQENGKETAIDDKELATRIVNYLKLMSGGSLDEAHNLAEKISPYKKSAIPILEKLLKAKAPLPGLQSVPKKVLEHYIKDMITKMG